LRTICKIAKKEWSSNCLNRRGCPWSTPSCLESLGPLLIRELGSMRPSRFMYDCQLFGLGVTKPPLQWRAPLLRSHSWIAVARWSGIGPEYVVPVFAKGFLEGVLGVEQPDLTTTPSRRAKMKNWGGSAVADASPRLTVMALEVETGASPFRSNARLGCATSATTCISLAASRSSPPSSSLYSCLCTRMAARALVPSKITFLSETPKESPSVCCSSLV
jgi:hypothetical protein